MMNITLTPHYEELLKHKLASGLYNTANEVINEALRLLEERDQRYELKLENLRTEIQRGINSGQATPLDIYSIKARGQARLAAKEVG
jgi:antitoxin ParD1/3/4